MKCNQLNFFKYVWIMNKKNSPNDLDPDVIKFIKCYAETEHTIKANNISSSGLKIFLLVPKLS